MKKITLKLTADNIAAVEKQLGSCSGVTIRRQLLASLNITDTTQGVGLSSASTRTIKRVGRASAKARKSS